MGSEQVSLRRSACSPAAGTPGRARGRGGVRVLAIGETRSARPGRRSSGSALTLPWIRRVRRSSCPPIPRRSGPSDRGTPTSGSRARRGASPCVSRLDPVSSAMCLWAEACVFGPSMCLSVGACVFRSEHVSFGWPEHVSSGRRGLPGGRQPARPRRGLVVGLLAAAGRGCSRRRLPDPRGPLAGLRVLRRRFRRPVRCLVVRVPRVRRDSGSRPVSRSAHLPSA